MKLIGRLKEDVENAAGKAEAMEIIRNAGMELTADELEMVSGGIGVAHPALPDQSHTPLGKWRCKKCGQTHTINYDVKEGCRKCGNKDINQFEYIPEIWQAPNLQIGF